MLPDLQPGEILAEGMDPAIKEIGRSFEAGGIMCLIYWFLPEPWHLFPLPLLILYAFGCHPTPLKRHYPPPFLVDFRIPYTSHNSSACLSVETVSILSVWDACCEYLLHACASGSDVGLCIAQPEQISCIYSNTLLK